MIDWDKISHVFLDMDGTLLDLYFDDYFWRTLVPRHYGKQHDLSFPDAKKQIETLYGNVENTLEWYSVDYWTKKLDLDIASLKTSITHLITERPNALPFLDIVRNNEKRAILVTNAHPISIALKMRYSQLSERVDTIISAHELGLPKENPEFWAHLQKVESFDSETTVLIDDSLPVLRSAAEYGIKQLFCIEKPNSHRPAQSCDEFTSIGDFLEIMP